MKAPALRPMMTAWTVLVYFNILFAIVRIAIQNSMLQSRKVVLPLFLRVHDLCLLFTHHKSYNYFRPAILQRGLLEHINASSDGGSGHLSCTSLAARWLWCST